MLGGSCCHLTACFSRNPRVPAAADNTDGFHRPHSLQSDCVRCALPPNIRGEPGEDNCRELLQFTRVVSFTKSAQATRRSLPDVLSSVNIGYTARDHRASDAAQGRDQWRVLLQANQVLCTEGCSRTDSGSQSQNTQHRHGKWDQQQTITVEEVSSAPETHVRTDPWLAVTSQLHTGVTRTTSVKRKQRQSPLVCG